MKASCDSAENIYAASFQKAGSSMRFDLEELPETDAIISALSHDLRSPLNTIIGFSEILLSKRIGKLNTEQQKQLSIILKRGSLLLATLDQLIDYTKVMRHEQRLQSASLALNILLTSTVERVREGRPAEAPPLIYRGSKGLYRIRGDEQKLYRLLMQIIDEGEELFQPREIRVSLGKIRHRGEDVSPYDFRIGIQFLGREMMDPGELLTWDSESRVPGKTKFALHLADFYMKLMKGKLGVSRRKGCIEFTLDFCEEEK